MTRIEEAAARLVRAAPQPPDLKTIQARALVYRRRRRVLRALMVSAVVVVIVGAGAIASGLLRDDSRDTSIFAGTPLPPSDTRPTYSDPERGFAISYPRSWHRAEEVLTPVLGGDPYPWEVVSLATFDLTGLTENEPCDQWPIGALRSLGPTDAVVWVYLPTGRDPAEVPPRPEGPTRLNVPTEIIECLGGTVDYFLGTGEYTVNGRVFGVLAALGSEASPTTRDEAFAVVNSIRLDEPKVVRGSSPATVIDPTTSTTIPTTSTTTPSTSEASAPSAEDKAAIREAFLGWLNNQDIDVAGAYIEDFGEIRDALAQAAATAPLPVADYTGRVDQVTVTSSSDAQVVYSILNQGSVVVRNQVGHAVKVDGAWKVSRNTICAAIAIGGVQCPL